MTPEEWQQVRPILESALELDPARRADFLDAACTDSSLRRELESLIAADEKGRSGFLHSPPVVRLIKGTRLGEYEIQSMVGAGGMGEVYRARDLRLRRDVAIKVLPAFVVCDHPHACRKSASGIFARKYAAHSHSSVTVSHPTGEPCRVQLLVAPAIAEGTMSLELLTAE